MASVLRVRLPFLLVAAVVLVASVGLALGPQYAGYRHDRTEKRFRAALATFELPEGVAEDATWTACEVYGTGRCVTSAHSAAGLVDALRAPLARRGARLERGCPMQDWGLLPADDVLGTTGRCDASARRAGVVLAVSATEGSLLPGNPRPRSSAWLSLDGASSTPPVTRVVGPDEIRAVLPPGFVLGDRQPAVPTDGPDQTRYALMPPPGTPAETALSRFAEALAEAGFRVVRPCRSDRPCPLVMSQRLGSDHTGLELDVYGSAQLTLVARAVAAVSAPP